MLVAGRPMPEDIAVDMDSYILMHLYGSCGLRGGRKNLFQGSYGGLRSHIVVVVVGERSIRAIYERNKVASHQLPSDTSERPKDKYTVTGEIEPEPERTHAAEEGGGGGKGIAPERSDVWTPTGSS